VYPPITHINLKAKKDPNSTFLKMNPHNIDLGIEEPTFPATLMRSTPNQRNSRPTLLDNALEKITEEESKQLFVLGARYSDSTLKKHKWVKGLYEGFALAHDINAWPIEGKTAAAFIRFCGLYACYSCNSIEDVIVPSLKRIDEELTGANISTEVAQYMANALRDIKHSKKSSSLKNSKDAAISKDIERIIRLTPDHHVEKASEASAWLCALYTGARAITITNVKLQNIIGVHKLEGNKIIIRIRFTRTKGREAWDHVVSIEGDLENTGHNNFVQFFNRHLRLVFGLDLENFDNWNLGALDGNRHVWRWNVDTLRETFKRRAEWAGYPRGMLAFHSIRAGFICTAIIKAGTDREALQAVLENTAYVADWVPHGQSQMRYVKSTVKRTIVCNRLVELGGTEGDSSSLPKGVIEASLTEPQAFHCLSEPLMNKWPKYMTPDPFCGEMKKRLWNAGEDALQNKIRYKKIMDKVYEKSCKANKVLFQRACLLSDKKTKVWVPKKHNTMLKSCCKKIGKKDICERLYSGQKTVSETILMLERFLKEKGINVKSQTEREKDAEERGEVERPRDEGNGARKRVYWTDEEQSVLLSMKERGMRWCDIAKSLVGRTGQDCRDKHRVIMEKTKKDEQKIEVNTDKEIEEDRPSTEYYSAMKKDVRKRRKWQKEEDSILIEMKRQDKAWTEISRNLEGRTNVDCKDRYRNIFNK
jgi:hypothetical protein